MGKMPENSCYWCSQLKPICLQNNLYTQVLGNTQKEGWGKNKNQGTRASSVRECCLFMAGKIHPCNICCLNDIWTMARPIGVTTWMQEIIQGLTRRKKKTTGSYWDRDNQSPPEMSLSLIRNPIPHILVYACMHGCICIECLCIQQLQINHHEFDKDGHRHTEKLVRRERKMI